MICKIQVVTLGEDGHQETREITCLQRTDLKPETLGLTLAEGKMILKDLQQILVEGQVARFLLPKRPCPECGQPRCIKGHHSGSSLPFGPAAADLAVANFDRSRSAKSRTNPGSFLRIKANPSDANPSYENRPFRDS